MYFQNINGIQQTQINFNFTHNFGPLPATPATPHPCLGAPIDAPCLPTSWGLAPSGGFDSFLGAFQENFGFHDGQFAFGGPGHDRIVQNGGPGNDRQVARGGRGNDVIIQRTGSGSGGTVARGGAGNDRMVLNAGKGRGNSVIHGGKGKDTAVIRTGNKPVTVVDGKGKVLFDRGEGGRTIRVNGVENVKIR